MRETGKSFRVLLQTLYVASLQKGEDKKDVILWCGNQHEVDHNLRLLMGMTYALSGVRRVRTNIIMPNSVTIKVMNMKNVEREARGLNMEDFIEFQDNTYDFDEYLKFETFMRPKRKTNVKTN